MKGTRKYAWLAGLLLALAVTVFSPLASPHPDGLERVAEEAGFIDRAADAPYEIIPDYVLPGPHSEGAATILAGVLGTLIVFGMVYGLAWVVRRRSDRAAS